MDTCTFHTYAGTYRIHAVIKGLYSYFRTLTRETGDVLDSDETFLDLRDLLLKETLQEQRSGTAEYDLGIRVLVIHLYDYGANDLTFAVLASSSISILEIFAGAKARWI